MISGGLALNSIMQKDKFCYLCKATCGEHLDRHHIFPGSLRNSSEKYGLWVYLCHDKCHENGKYAAHKCVETQQKLKKEAQEAAMKEYGWTVDEWRERFYKNYLEE